MCCALNARLRRSARTELPLDPFADASSGSQGVKQFLNVSPTLGRVASRSRDAAQPQQPQAGKSTAHSDRRTDRQTPTRAGSAAGAKLTGLINLALYRGCVRKRGSSRKSWLPATEVTTEVTTSGGQTHQGTHPGLTVDIQQKVPGMEGRRRTSSIPKHPVGSGLGPDSSIPPSQDAPRG